MAASLLPACGEPTVHSPQPPGRAEVRVEPNATPTITSITATPGHIGPGESTQLQVVVAESDGEALELRWSDEGGACAGAFDATDGQTAQWTAPAELPPGGVCRIHVRAADTRGAEHRGELGIAVELSAVSGRTSWPDSLTTYQSTAEAEAGQQVLFRVTVGQPPSEPLAFDWRADAGTVVATESSTATSELLWSAPNVPGSHSIAASVRTATADVQHVFTVLTP